MTIFSDTSSLCNATLAQLELPTASQNYVQALKLTHELTVRGCTLAHVSDMPVALALLGWTMTTQDMRTSEHSPRWSYTPCFYSEVVLPPPFPVVCVIRDIFCMYLNIVAESPILKLLNRTGFNIFIDLAEHTE